MHWRDALAMGAVNHSCRRKWLDRQDSLLSPQLTLLEDKIDNGLYQDNNKDDPRLEDDYSTMNVTEKLGVLKNYKSIVEKQQFLAFAGALLTYLEQKNPDMHDQAKMMIQECVVEAKQSTGRQHSESSDNKRVASLEIRLKEFVGQRYWDRAGIYLKRLLQDDQITLTSLSSTIFTPFASFREETQATAMSHDEVEEEEDEEEEEEEEETRTKTPALPTKVQQPEEIQDPLNPESHESSRVTNSTRTVSTTFFDEVEQEVTPLWFMERVCVFLHSIGQEAVIQQINPDGITATVKLRNEESSTQNVQFHDISSITPKVHDMVLAINGVDVGVEGELVCIDGPDGIVKESNGEFKIIELVHLTKIDIEEE